MIISKTPGDASDSVMKNTATATDHTSLLLKTTAQHDTESQSAEHRITKRDDRLLALLVNDEAGNPEADHDDDEH